MRSSVDPATLSGRPSVLIRHATAIYPCATRNEAPIVDGWLRIDGPRITALGPEPSRRRPKSNWTGAASSSILGLVNVHHHFWQSLTRAVPFGRSERSVGWLARCTRSGRSSTPTRCTPAFSSRPPSSS
jgi:cytosine/adenosine deaminase-related metal-dependent hydrolase